MSTSPVRVVVVDDEPPIIELLTGYLVREGYEVASAADGPAALEAIRTGAPDVVVLDVMLPGLDGIEVCRQMRAFSDAYVLMLTARGEEIDRIVGLTVGADDYLVCLNTLVFVSSIGSDERSQTAVATSVALDMRGPAGTGGGTEVRLRDARRSLPAWSIQRRWVAATAASGTS